MSLSQTQSEVGQTGSRAMSALGLGSFLITKLRHMPSEVQKREDKERGRLLGPSVPFLPVFTLRFPCLSHMCDLPPPPLSATY